jgi:hypothetical protein
MAQIRSYPHRTGIRWWPPDLNLTVRIFMNRDLILCADLAIEGQDHQQMNWYANLIPAVAERINGQGISSSPGENLGESSAPHGGGTRRRTSNPTPRYPNRPLARAIRRQEKGKHRETTHETRKLVTRVSHGEERTRGGGGATTRNLSGHGDAHARLQARA